MADPGPWTLTNSARTKLITGVFDLDSDTWKVGLLTSGSNIGAASTTWAGVTSQHAQQYGYLTGGVTVTFTLTGTTDVDVSFTTNPSWTASGGSIVARWAALYESGGDVLAYSLLDATPADVTTTTGSILVVYGQPVFTVA